MPVRPSFRSSSQIFLRSFQPASVLVSSSHCPLYSFSRTLYNLPSILPWLSFPRNHLCSVLLYRETAGRFLLSGPREGLGTTETASTGHKSKKAWKMERKDDIITLPFPFTSRYGGDVNSLVTPERRAIKGDHDQDISGIKRAERSRVVAETINCLTSTAIISDGFCCVCLT
jgi:hypothetical protein